MRQTRKTAQPLDVRRNHTTLFTSRTQTLRLISEVPVAIVVTSSSWNLNNARRRRVRALVTKQLPSRRASIMMTAQENIILETNCNKREPAFMKEELSIKLLLLLVPTLVC